MRHESHGRKLSAAKTIHRDIFADFAQLRDRFRDQPGFHPLTSGTTVAIILLLFFMVDVGIPMSFSIESEQLEIREVAGYVRGMGATKMLSDSPILIAASMTEAVLLLNRQQLQ